MKKLKIRFCPRCKSVNVKIRISTSAAYGAPQKWICEDCNYSSFSPFPEKEIKLKNKKKK
jgi:transposase-like protein